MILWAQFRSLGYYHIAGFLYLLFLPAFVRAASRAAFGEKAGVVSSLRFALERWRSYLWLAVLKHAAVLIGPEAAVFGVMFAIGTVEDKLGLFDSAPAASVIAVLLPIPAGIFLFLWLGACLAFIVPAAALEEMAGFRALRRSWRLSRGSRLRIFGTWIMVGLIQNILVWSTYFLLRSALALFQSGRYFSVFDQRLYTSGTYLLYGVIAAFVTPLYPIAITLFYYDQRVRKEGYDLEKMMEAAGLNGVLGAESAPMIQGREGALGRQEIGA